MVISCTYFLTSDMRTYKNELKINIFKHTMRNRDYFFKMLKKS